MDNPPNQIHCACPCGSTAFVAAAKPLLRFICHCTICQTVYKKPFADILAFRLGDVVASEAHPIDFKRHRLPPTVNRGICPACSAPAFGNLSLLPGYGFTFVPTANVPDGIDVPDASLHSFYDRRQQDIADDLPKVGGYWPSQWAVSSRLMAARLRLA